MHPSREAKPNSEIELGSTEKQGFSGTTIDSVDPSTSPIAGGPWSRARGWAHAALRVKD